MIRVAAGMCFVLALAVAVVAGLMATSLISEYGAAEGYGNLAVQTLPIVAVALVMAGGLGWAGLRLLRRRAR